MGFHIGILSFSKKISLWLLCDLRNLFLLLEIVSSLIQSEDKKNLFSESNIDKLFDIKNKGKKMCTHIDASELFIKAEQFPVGAAMVVVVVVKHTIKTPDTTGLIWFNCWRAFWRFSCH